jgi:hypothetical protein
MGLGDPPVQLMLLGGEIAYQLRSALDHLVYIFAVETPEGKREFPIFDTPEEYEKRGRAKIRGMPPRLAAIVESVQPFHRGAAKHQDTLWMLHRINIIDKHRIIPASVVYTSDVKVRVETDRGFDVHLLVMEQVCFEDGTELTSFPLPDLNVSVDTETFCAVAFAEIADSKYEAIVPFFTRAICDVSDIVEQF